MTNKIDLKALIENSPDGSGETIVNQVRHCRDVAMLHTYFGLSDFTFDAINVVKGQSCNFDLFEMATQTCVRIFRALDTAEVHKIAGHQKLASCICVLDAEELGLTVTRRECHGRPYVSLENRTFDTARLLNAYLLFEQKLWCCHLGTNLWEPMLPLAIREHYLQPIPSAQ